MFMKYLQPTDQVDIILIAIKSFRSPSIYSISAAAYMVDILVEDPAFQPGQVSSPWVAQLMLQPTRGPFLPGHWPALVQSQAGIPQQEQKQLPVGAGEMAALTLLTSPLSSLQVLTIVWTIYGNLPSITAAVAHNSLNRALLVLTNKHPAEVVASLLQCSPTCTQYRTHQPLRLLSQWERGPNTLLRDVSPVILQGVPADRAPGLHSVAMAMWKIMFSKPQAAKKVLQELVSMLMNQPLRKTSTSSKDNPRILSLAVSC